jgi:hypothetical protein
VTGRKQIGGRRGPVAALFVLFGLLLNVAGATGAQLDRDPRAARLGNGEIVRTAPGARLASRIDDDGTDQDEVSASLPPEPRIAALAATLHPAGASDALAATARPLDPRSPYQARAPPAA